MRSLASGRGRLKLKTMKYYHSLRTSEEYYNDHYGKETFNPTVIIVIMKGELKKRVKRKPKKEVNEQLKRFKR
tara:strand:+ start:860 stop:1078 length:219 start_codon:yes stop_codon:yes gene_type:complete